VIDHTKRTAKHAPKEANRRTVIDPFAAAAIRLLILTGARLREILKLEWQHEDLERGLLLLPDSKTGAKSIILNAPALTVLAGIQRVGTYVIAGQSAGNAGEKPRADLNRPWRSIANGPGSRGCAFTTCGTLMRASVQARASVCRLSASSWGTRAPARRSAMRISTQTRCGAHPSISAAASPRPWANPSKSRAPRVR
jgi:hypothetical protein